MGLDISTKTGYAVLEDGVLTKYGLLKAEDSDEYTLNDLNYLVRAELMANKIAFLILAENPDFIYVEQTNQGRFKSQKLLEFIHCLFLKFVVHKSITTTTFYVDTSKWRSTLQIRLTKDQKKHNKLVKGKLARGKITPKHLVVTWANETYSQTFKKKDHDICDAIALCKFGELQSQVPKRDSPSIDIGLKTK